MIGEASELTQLCAPGPEQLAYAEVDGELVYHVRHSPPSLPVARVLLAAPFGLERQTSYLTWVRWARYLASRGLEAIHFDYRGTGESTGRFEQYCLTDWKTDIAALARQLSSDARVPLLLCGLRMGALLCAELFAEGLGAALLAWAPPPGGQAMLTAVLRRKLASDLLEGLAGPLRTRAAYVERLCSGAALDVEGFPWTQRLWQDAGAHRLVEPPAGDERPWQWWSLEASPAPACREGHSRQIPVGKPPFWGHDPVVLPELNHLFEAGGQFLQHAAGLAEP